MVSPIPICPARRVIWVRTGSAPGAGGSPRGAGGRGVVLPGVVHGVVTSRGGCQLRVVISSCPSDPSLGRAGVGGSGPQQAPPGGGRGVGTPGGGGSCRKSRSNSSCSGWENFNSGLLSRNWEKSSNSCSMLSADSSLLRRGGEHVRRVDTEG